MMYEYLCDSCEKKYTVVKPAAESHTTENCPACKTSMNKVFTATYLNTGNSFKPGYNPAFGKVINSKHELKETLAKYKIDSGRELHEVGNDKQESIKHTPKSYDDDIVDRIKI